MEVGSPIAKMTTSSLPSFSWSIAWSVCIYCLSLGLMPSSSRHFVIAISGVPFGMLIWTRFPCRSLMFFIGSFVRVTISK